MAEIEAKTFSHLFPYTKLPCICTLPVVRGKQTFVAGVFDTVAGFRNVDNSPAVAKYLLLTTIQIFRVKEDVLCGEGL
jgi:hypothetical protein